MVASNATIKEHTRENFMAASWPESTHTNPADLEQQLQKCGRSMESDESVMQVLTQIVGETRQPRPAQLQNLTGANDDRSDAQGWMYEL